MAWVGIDMGGTSTKIGLVDRNGKILDQRIFSTKDFSRPNNWIKRVLLEIKSFRRPIKGIGIGVPGAVNFSEGKVLYLPNVPEWKNVRLVDKLLAGIGSKNIPVAVDNDATVMALAEARVGAGKGVANLVCLTLGTGVGGGIVINGEIYRGADGVAGEIGHFPLVPWGRDCSCGGKGCLERYVGNSALIGWAKKMKLLGPKENDLAKVTWLSRKGDRRAIEFWDRVAYTMAPAIIGLVNLLNPELVIIGGGIAEAGGFLLNPLRNYVRSYAMRVQAKRVKIVKAKLGNSAGIIGASFLVR